MKHFISLSLLFISCIVCKGQIVRINDSLGIIMSGTFEAFDSSFIAKEKRLGRQYTVAEVIDWWDTTKYYFSSLKPKTDTIKIIYQYSDTAITKMFVGDSKEPFYEFYNYEVKWAYGYLVIVSNQYSSIEHYLDADKQPIYKNIVVWKYIEIE